MHEKNLNFYYKGFISYLGNVPVMSIFCNITNLHNNKITYAKAGGTYCILKKIKKSKSKEDFKAKWTNIKPLIQRLLRQEDVKKNEWFNLFS